MKNTVYFLGLCLSLAFNSISCSPKIYVIDQPSIMEMESAGEWPEFETETENNLSQFGPTPYPKETMNQKTQKKMKTLLGESSRQSLNYNSSPTSK